VRNRSGNLADKAVKPQISYTLPCHLNLFCVSVRDMRERQSDDADVPLRPSCCVPEVLREDDPDGSVSTAVAPPLRHLPRQDSSAEAKRRDVRGRPSADVSVALLCG
jgi:hypothetical protein